MRRDDGKRRAKEIAWAKETLSRKDVMVLDTETTGLDFKEDRIIEISLLRMDGTPYASELINPEGRPVSPGAFEANHINGQSLASKRKFREIAEHIVRVIRNYTLIGWNVRFDAGMVRGELERLALLYPEIMTDDAMAHYCAFAHPGYKRVSLQTALMEVGITERQDHRSLSDCRMTREVIKKMALWEDK